MHAAVDASRDEACALEHFEVPRDRGERHVERFGELADGGGAARQPREDASSRRVPEGTEYEVQSGLDGRAARPRARGVPCAHVPAAGSQRLTALFIIGPTSIHSSTEILGERFPVVRAPAAGEVIAEA